MNVWWIGSLLVGSVPIHALAEETGGSTGEVRSKAEQRRAEKALKENAVLEFKKVTKLQDEAFELTNQLRFAEAEKLWTEIIALNTSNAAAYSNRGNCRTSQRRFDEAIADFRAAIALSPDEPDPFLGLGVALEGKRDFPAAIRAYEQSNALSRRRFGTDDPAAINNIGNAHAGRGEWDLALANYKRAAMLDKNFVFALANEALAYAQLGEDQIAVRTMKFLVRKYPYFPDMHAALAALYWETGDYSSAEDEFLLATGQDYRYRDLEWIASIRRFPPRIVRDLENLRNLRK
ncbi:UDP-N-acetylglucosamine--peptide N-acetylglucosaminyltransferase [Porphyridium purpureum]|uniref:UDP-N-acetylglucosamine--peptide N-acetylglucosaminyltransferase n=1 Tax=Porphyridium purpureum TaxID=35688 RepID=A0A5J4YW11_PORPP|nr:UDP-N-acetylglucosamine--peptide N-acetylglucosaminyltransferase [Porphyridium purpureum]|eukprot:POR7561..scf209_3